MRRYVPLAVWVIVLMALLLIPLKVITYGYIPPDDALRSAAKAVSGKTWPQILVLNENIYKIDHEYGWSALLAKFHSVFDADPDAIVIFSVVSLFVLAGLAGVPWLRFPETWLFTLAFSMVTVALPMRLLLGRPFVITMAALMALLSLWRRFGPEKPRWWMAALMTSFIAASVYLHGTWYLWGLPVAAFFFAGQFRWGFTLAGCWVGGVIVGCLLTGHPIEYPTQAVRVLQATTGMHSTQRTLASEMQPSSGDTMAFYVLGGLLLLRRLAPLKTQPLLRDPVFWVIAMAWTLGFKVGRFWDDWGWPAMMVMIAWDLQAFMAARVSIESLRRLAVAVAAAVVAFLSITADVGSRWTYSLTQQYLTADNPDLKGWLPDKGGIFYSTDMSLFYQTFFKNPHGDWRYILGFEATLMPPKDFEVYHKVLWNFGDAKAYEPWLLKMTPADRLVIRGSRSSPPHIPQLEWNYAVSGIWIGRLPDHKDGVPATVPATESMSSLTNSVPQLKP
jgi:hypothetical protein